MVADLRQVSKVVADLRINLELFRQHTASLYGFYVCLFRLFFLCWPVLLSRLASREVLSGAICNKGA